MKKQLVLFLLNFILMVADAGASCFVQICSHTDALCNGGCTGTAAMCPSGGTPPYTYMWQPSMQTGQTVTGLCAGTYTCSITDGVGCLTWTTVTITQPPLLTAQVCNYTNVSCFNGNNGCTSACFSGGTPPYTYLWSPTGGTGATACNLTAGAYTIRITDSHGCSTTAAVTITQPPALTAVGSTIANVPCNAGCTGIVGVTAGGGTGTYTYHWSPSGGNAATASNLCLGTYTATVTDANGCTATATATVNQTGNLFVQSCGITPPSCNGGTGCASLCPSGGTPPYTYYWNTSPPQTTATACGLGVGTYTATVTDANGCSAVTSVTMTQPAVLNATVNGYPASCHGSCNGALVATPSGGTPAYTYTWNTSPVQHGQTATGLCAGNYTVTVTDSHGCTRVVTSTVTEPAQLTLTMTSSNSSCMTCPNGWAAGSPSGGTPGYTYMWTPTVGTGQTATGLLPGTYTCCVTDARGCSTCSTVTVASNCPVPTIQASNITFTNVTANSATVNWTSGNGSRRIVKIKPTNTFTAPQNGYDYTANPVYTGSGEQVIYNGTGSSVNVTGLSSNTYYWFRVYEASCTGNFSAYQPLSASGNPRRLLTPTNSNPNRPEENIDEQTETNTFQIVPNPAHNSFTVSFNKESGIGNWELGIFDVTGRLVYKQNNQSSSVNFHLRAGVYLVKVSAGEKVYNRKLIVE